MTRASSRCAATWSSATAGDVPLTLSASVTFEQSYAGVEGDSAASAELYALLSSLAGIPLRQGIAVTGSVDQHGDVQAIGAVNEKIEGFYAVCRRSGLTGEQGVIIPRSNVRHLMLRDEVIDAVQAGRFNIWAVATIDEGLELLTGIRPAAAPQTESSPIRQSTQGSRSDCCHWPRPRAGSRTLSPHPDPSARGSRGRPAVLTAPRGEQTRPRCAAPRPAASPRSRPAAPVDGLDGRQPRDRRRTVARGGCLLGPVERPPHGRSVARERRAEARAPVRCDVLGLLLERCRAARARRSRGRQQVVRKRCAVVAQAALGAHECRHDRDPRSSGIGTVGGPQRPVPGLGLPGHQRQSRANRIGPLAARAPANVSGGPVRVSRAADCRGRRSPARTRRSRR